jgi:hypothetical protein
MRQKYKKKAPKKGAINIKIRQRHTFPAVTPVSSALMGLTSLFGMVRGGHHRYSCHKGCMTEIESKK